MVSRRGSLLKIIMIITYLQYSSRRSLMIEEEVEGMTCDLMAIAGGGGLEEEVHYSFMMNGNRVLDITRTRPLHHAQQCPSPYHQMPPREVGPRRSLISAKNSRSCPSVRLALTTPNFQLMSSFRCWCYRSCSSRGKLPSEKR